MAQTKSLLNVNFLSRTLDKCINLSYARRFVSLEEVSFHDTISDCWIVIFDRVYDITTFLDEHPGGHEILMEYAGRDASCAFGSSGHSKTALHELKRFYIGELPTEEKLFSKVGGFALIDLS